MRLIVDILPDGKPPEPTPRASPSDYFVTARRSATAPAAWATGGLTTSPPHRMHRPKTSFGAVVAVLRSGGAGWCAVAGLITLLACLFGTYMTYSMQISSAAGGSGAFASTVPMHALKSWWWRGIAPSALPLGDPLGATVAGTYLWVREKAARRFTPVLYLVAGLLLIGWTLYDWPNVGTNTDDLGQYSGISFQMAQGVKAGTEPWLALAGGVITAGGGVLDRLISLSRPPT